MEFKYRPRKAAQASAFLLESAGGSMNYLKLTKLLYLADRSALVQIGRPITGDRMVSMPFGPALSQTLNCTRRTGPSAQAALEWNNLISAPDGYTVSLAGNSSYDELSDSEMRILGDTYEEFGQLGRFDLVEYTHDAARVPEWRDPQGSSQPIDPEEILRLEGWSEDDIMAVRGQLAAAAGL